VCVRRSLECPECSDHTTDASGSWATDAAQRLLAPNGYLNVCTPLHAIDAHFGGDRRVCWPRKLLFLKITVGELRGSINTSPTPPFEALLLICSAEYFSSTRKCKSSSED
jgi:hypothetical protein